VRDYLHDRTVLIESCCTREHHGGTGLCIVQDLPHDTKEDHADPDDVSIVYVYPGLASTATSLLHTLSTAFVGMHMHALLDSIRSKSNVPCLHMSTFELEKNGACRDCRDRR
jgi:hypothetical protein